LYYGLKKIKYIIGLKGLKELKEGLKWHCCEGNFRFKLKPGHLRENVNDLLEDSEGHLVEDHSSGCKQSEFHEDIQ